MLDAIVYIALLVTVWNLGRASLRAEMIEKELQRCNNDVARRNSRYSR